MKRLIAITVPYFFPQEGDILSTLFEEGLECLHIRKPQSCPEEIKKLLDTIPDIYHSRIKLHDCFELVNEYPVDGIHLNSRNNSISTSFKGSLSRSCHSLQEVENCNKYDYVFLSPIFRSISKEGYGGGFSIKQLEEASAKGIINEKVIALGGMDKKSIPLIKHLNFGGIAVLGALWGKEPEKKDLVIKQYKELQV